MDLEVVGRHALLFDDDALAEFVNSPVALVDWNSLPIDRYDVRHLLSAPPPRRRNHSPNPDDPLESDLDHERYLDLPSTSDSPDLEDVAERENAGAYRAVPFSYGNSSEDRDQKDADADSGFRPPFAVPEHLLQSLPPTEKVHQIIAKTAMFVNKHGGQSEIVLRVKQGANPTFGFLMPDHDLHPYYRFLVDHQEVLKTSLDGNSMEEENRVESAVNQMGGALSLLGSVYGSVEEEEGVAKDSSKLAGNVSEEAVNGDGIIISHGPEQAIASSNLAGKDETSSKHAVAPLKGKSHVIKKNNSISPFKPGTITAVKKGDSFGSVSSLTDNLQASSSLGLSKVEPSVLEPPSDLKRVVEKIVEFILRNGKEFESVLVQQDTKHGRFPFLIPSNQYHAYYLKVLQKAQESRSAGRFLVSEKHDPVGHGADNKIFSKESDTLPLSSDIPYDPDRKEKFRMVIGKSKKDGQDQPPKSTLPRVEVNVDAAAAAAILQAATKGIRNPSLNILSKTSGNGLSRGCSGEELNDSYQLKNPIQKQDQRKSGDSGSVAGGTNASASEADSSDTSLSREQKLKAERLKRAKMFAAMIQSRGNQLKSGPLRGSSVEPQASGVSESSAQFANCVNKEQGSSVPLDIGTFDKIENSENKESFDSYTGQRSKRKYRLRSKGEEEEEESDADGNKDYKVSRKKRSHRSSRHSRDTHEKRKRHSSKDKDSRHRHKCSSTSDDENQGTSGFDQHRQRSNSSSDDGYGRSRHKRKHKGSDDEEHRHHRHERRRDKSSEYERRHSCRRGKHNISSDDDDEQKISRRRENQKHDMSSGDEHRQSRRRKKYDNSSDEEHSHMSRHHHRHRSCSDVERRHGKASNKHRKISPKESDLEEGEILARSDHHSKVSEGASREALVDLSKSYHDSRPLSQPSETTEVSDDLRAKIRAMLMATL
ncbi:hypothetical protein Tsubulata_017479 [Turnera subulata]|uniref:SURP motif domain-containing protein n=1 Tax=Turnera subulata TaxID=218843 RepID=A0A9Q0FH94_9ROSI|nr:hypothetical protein Tsubulata_017479 [Turnera subulata]